MTALAPKNHGINDSMPLVLPVTAGGDIGGNGARTCPIASSGCSGAGTNRATGGGPSTFGLNACEAGGVGG
jgi:hypothetical protein